MVNVRRQGRFVGLCGFIDDLVDCCDILQRTLPYRNMRQLNQRPKGIQVSDRRLGCPRRFAVKRSILASLNYKPDTLEKALRIRKRLSPVLLGHGCSAHRLTDLREKTGMSASYSALNM